MPEFIPGEFPMIKFSSREEVGSYFRETLSSTFQKTPELQGVDLEHFINNAIKDIELNAFDIRKDGYVFQHQVDTLAKQLVKTAEAILGDLRRHSEPVKIVARQQAAAPHSSAPSPARRGFLIAGIAAGGLLSIHGAVAAATAVNKDDRRQRDWGRTALHTAEALLGGALTWVSVAALRGRSPIGR